MGLFSRKNKATYYGAEVTGSEAPAAPPGSPEGHFLFRVDDTFSITGRGLVVTGVVESGVISQHDEVTVETTAGLRTTTVHGIEMGRRVVTAARAGQEAGLLLFQNDKSVHHQDVQRGAAITLARTASGAAALPWARATAWSQQAQPPASPSAPGHDAAPAPRPAGTPLGSTLRLGSAGDRKIAVIKELKDATQWGLADTKAVVDAAPVEVQVPISSEAAAALVASLRRLGAQADLV